MEITELPTGNFTILCIAAALCIIFAIACFMGYSNDEEELQAVRDVVYFQENIPQKDPVYILTLRIESSYAYSGWTDLIIRLRGSLRDSPLILLRDYDGRYFANDKTLNLGFSLPFELGSIVEIDITGDNSDFDEGDSILTFSDLFIRKLPRKAEALANSKTRMMLKSGESPFEALSKNVRTWASVETFTAPKGVNVLGVSVPDIGRSRTVRARDCAVSLSLQEEASTVKKEARIGFRPLHYIWSQEQSWHEAWSEYSHLDQQMVMCLDVIAILVTIASCYAYGVERLLGASVISNKFEPMLEGASGPPAVSVQEFDLTNLFSDFTRYIIPLVLVAYMSLVGSTLVIPLSLLWCRLFRLIGGKGFEKALEDAQPPVPVSNGQSLRSFYTPTPRARSPEKRRNNKNGQTSKTPHVSARHHDDNHFFADDFFDGSCLMLRTLECKSTHTASCVTSSRRLRMEPLITNCSADHITARSIAYIRTKMTKLRDETILSGQSGLKHPDVLHESHTQSTDAPQMPPPSTAPDGSGDVVRISRYCERLVQQAVRHIHDNSVIAECFEVAPHVDAGGVPGKKPNKFANCCPRRCCGMKGNPNESISNLTFFTEEDAISLQEMCDHMPAPSPLKQKMREIAPRPPAGDATMSDIRLDNLDSEVQEEQPSIPVPSAKPRKSSLKKFSLKNMRKSPSKKVYESPSEIKEGNNKQHRIRGLIVLPSFGKKGKNMTDVEEAKSPPKREKNKKGVRFQDETKKKKARVKDRSSVKENLQKIGAKAEKDDSESQKVLKKYRERTRKSKSLPSVPFPSVRSDVFYDPVADDGPHYDWTSAKSEFPEPPDKEALPQSAPFKGNTVKMCVFGFLLLLQLGEIYFVTNVKMEDNKFFIRNIDESPGPGASRMNCALLSCILAVIWYPLFTVHAIALLSYLAEYIRLQVSGDDESYEETDSPTTSRHSLTALP